MQLVIACVALSFLALAGYAIYVEIDERRWRKYMNERNERD